MLIFNELKITPDNKHLIIDVSVREESYYNDIQIKSIIIDSQDTYTDSGHSSDPIFTYNVTSTSPSIISAEVTDSNRRVRLILDKNDLGVSLEGTMFFVYAVTTGAPAADTPCGMDNETTLGVTMSLYSTYCAAMQYIQDFNNKCSLPKGFIDMILRLKVLELSVKTGNYIQAIEYWNKYFSNNKTYQPSISCGCNNV